MPEYIPTLAVGRKASRVERFSDALAVMMGRPLYMIALLPKSIHVTSAR